MSIDTSARKSVTLALAAAAMVSATALAAGQNRAFDTQSEVVGQPPNLGKDVPSTPQAAPASSEALSDIAPGMVNGRAYYRGDSTTAPGMADDAARQPQGSMSRDTNRVEAHTPHTGRFRRGTPPPAARRATFR